MKNETVELLVSKVDTAVTTLSTKLGVASDHFYPILVKQQVIGGYISLGWAAISLVFAVLLTVIAVIQIKEDSADGDAVAWSVFIAVILYMSTMVQSYDGILSILNPEYYALQEITRLIK